MDNLVNAKKFTETCNRLGEICASLKPFVDEANNIVNDLIKQNGELYKEATLLKSQVMSLEEALKTYQKRSAMISTWFGEDFVALIDIAANKAIERYGKK